MYNLINTHTHTHTHNLCREGVALASTRQLRSQGPVSVHAHRTEGVTGSEGREGANGVGGGIGVGGGNESSSGDGNGDEDGNEDVIGEGGGEAKKRKKPHKNCRRDQALLFRTRHHLCRQGVALAGTRQLPSQGLLSVHAYRTERLTRSEGRE